MNRAVVNVLSAIAMAIVTSAGYGQGRHDEKPHATAKPAPSSSEAAASGGRHDEGGTTHGKKKATEVQSKDKAKSSETSHNK